MNLATHVKKISAGFYAAAGILALSILYAFTGGTLKIFGLGIFLFKCFHALALYLPVYLVFAGLLLGKDPIPKKELVRLNLTILPFITLSLFLHIALGHTEIRIVQSFIVAFGKAVASLLLFFLAGLEVLLIYKLTGHLFSGNDFYSSTLPRNSDLASGGLSDNTPYYPELYREPERSSEPEIKAPFAFPDLPEPVRPLEKEELEGIPGGDPAISRMIDRILRGESVEEAEQDYNSEKIAVNTEPAPLEEDPGISFLQGDDPLSGHTANPASAEEYFEELNEDVETEEKINYLIDSLDSVLTDNVPEEDRDNVGLSEKFSSEAPEDKASFNPSASSAIKKKRHIYEVPIDGILADYPESDFNIIDDSARQAASVLEETLKEFNIDARVTGIKKGPVITMFELLPSPGVKLSKIVNLQDNIALRLAASRVRIVAPIPGKHAVGIEIPNKKRAIVSFSSIIRDKGDSTKDMALPFFLGKDIQGGTQVIDLARTPHLLIAGATGSGKSVCVNSLICSLMYECHPADVKLMLVDPKIVELKLYNDIPHLLTPVITDTKRALQALQWCLYEMERRYAMLDSLAVRDIQAHNHKIKKKKLAREKMPYIVVIIDEFADLMATAGKELEGIVARLAAMSRAVGIHLVLATQRPSTDVITGLIKANFPSRIAFMVASKIDSRIIIDANGSEKLLGRGDMLFTSSWDPFPTRLQGAFLAEEEVERITEKSREYGPPEYIDDEIFYDEDEDEDQLHLFGDSNDPLFDRALEIVTNAGKASASYLQRRLKIGYNRAARLVEEMEARGIVGPQNGSKPRDVIGSGPELNYDHASLS